MKLGTDTNSLVNYCYGNVISKAPEVGMGATLLMWTDRYPYTIHKVEGKKIWASRDSYERTDKNGYFTEAQEYRYWNDNEKNPERWELFTFRKDSRWHQGNTLKGQVLLVGKREAYNDPSF